MNGQLSPDQLRVLRLDLARSRVLTTQGQSYLAAWDVRAHLTRVFGYGGWDFFVKELHLIREHHLTDDDGNERKFTVTYRATGTLTVRNYEGELVATYEDAAVGGATNQPTAEAAHDLAVKSAVSGSLKRCAVNLGTQFGLSLYNKGQVIDVIRQLVSDGAELPEHADVVEDGEGA